MVHQIKHTKYSENVNKTNHPFHLQLLYVIQQSVNSSEGHPGIASIVIDYFGKMGSSCFTNDTDTVLHNIKMNI